MKRTQKENIDFAVLLFSAILLCFSLYCWAHVLTAGMKAIFSVPGISAQTSQNLVLVETETVGNETGEMVQEEITQEQRTMEIQQAEEERIPQENPFQRLDDLIARIDNFWYVNVCRENEWSGMDSAATYVATGEISSSQVLLGKERWLFYKSVFDNDPIGDYDGTKHFTQEEMERMGQGALRVQNELEERGIQFTVLLCPNKENVYAAYMPENYVHAEKARTDLLAEHLEREGVSVVNLKKDMIRESEKYPLYYFYDTHWNQLGGYVGTENLLRSWGMDFPRLDEREIITKKLWDCANRECNDDLARIARLQFVFDDELEYVVEGTFIVDWSNIEEDGYLRFENPEAVRSEKVLLVGDSFRRAMLPSLCEEFREVYVVHRNNYETGMLYEIVPDYVIAEYVERYSGEMLDMEGLFF